MEPASAARTLRCEFFERLSSAARHRDAIKKAVLYFDHNATHPLSAAAKKAWLDAVEKYPANPSSQHRPGQREDAALDAAREALAARLKTRGQ